ncbi:MAG: hypothetical protein NWR99_02735 [Verrucomicrobiales bacterium]|nr:hypothetical protein [Verrucomicrobiales bacterium]
MKNGEDAVALLLDLLGELDIEYMVVGSFSSNRYGVPRATKDADLVLKVVASEREKLFSKLPTTFEIDPQVTFETITGTWRQIIEIPSIPFTIELFELSDDPHDQSRFARRKTLTLLSRQASIPTAEDVIVQKLRWSKAGKRSKDFDDCVAVMAVQGEAKLDWPYIEKWCTLHGTMEILAQAKGEASTAWDLPN